MTKNALLAKTVQDLAQELEEELQRSAMKDEMIALQVCVCVCVCCSFDAAPISCLFHLYCMPRGQARKLSLLSLSSTAEQPHRTLHQAHQHQAPPPPRQGNGAGSRLELLRQLTKKST